MVLTGISFLANDVAHLFLCVLEHFLFLKLQFKELPQTLRDSGRDFAVAAVTVTTLFLLCHPRAESKLKARVTMKAY